MPNPSKDPSLELGGSAVGRPYWIAWVTFAPWTTPPVLSTTVPRTDVVPVRAATLEVRETKRGETTEDFAS